MQIAPLLIKSAVCSGIRRKVQIRKQDLAFAQHRAFDRLRLLDLDDHLRALEHFFGARSDLRAGTAIVVVGGADAGAGIGLHQYRMTMHLHLTHRRRRQADAIFVDLDFFRNADQHCSP